MNLIVQKVVVVQSFEGLEHLLYLASQVLYQGLVLDSEDVLVEAGRFLRHSLLLLVHYRQKDLALVMLWLHFLGFEVNYLPKLVHTVTASQDLAKDLTRYLLQLVL